MPFYSFPFKAMGSPCELRLLSEQAAEQVEAKAGEVVRHVLQLEQKYSRYLPDSITSRINENAGLNRPVEVDEETAGLLDYAEVAFEQSEGLFDITSGILRRVWNFKSGQLPHPQELEALLPLIGWQHVSWQRPFISLPKKKMQLDFGGYVKEYAADSAATKCQHLGFEAGLVDLGGDISVVGNAISKPWIVGIRDPQAPASAIAKISLCQGGLATSGNYERFMMIDGKRYSHILNPITGKPVDTLASVSVAGEQCLVAGTAATITMLKGPEEGSRWLRKLNLPYLMITQEGEIDGTLRECTDEA